MNADNNDIMLIDAPIETLYLVHLFTYTNSSSLSLHLRFSLTLPILLSMPRVCLEYG